MMKTQLTTNLERDLLKSLKKQKHPEFMIQPRMKKFKKKIDNLKNHKDL